MSDDKEIYLPVTVELKPLALSIANSGLSNDDLLDFVLALDEEVAELGFTQDLRNSLTEVLKAEGSE